MVQCPTCHAHFTQNFIVLSLPIPLLEYLKSYVVNTPKARRRPLHKVFDLLFNASQGKTVSLPDPKPILPYLGLYTVVTLNPEREESAQLPTPHMPHLSILRRGRFIRASARTSATAENVARVFDPLAVDHCTPQNCDTIPLSPKHPQFKEQRYWRLPIPAPAVFAALVARLQYDLSGCKDIELATFIRDTLSLGRIGGIVALDPKDGSGPSGGGRRGGGRGGKSPSPGDTPKKKRKNPARNRNASPGPSQKKPRQAAGMRNAAGCRGRLRGTIDSPAQKLSSYELRDDFTATSSSSLADDAHLQLMHASGCDSGSESGLSVSAIHPHDKDDPDTWRFGPSFSTNKNVFTARAFCLM